MVMGTSFRLSSYYPKEAVIMIAFIFVYDLYLI